MKKEVVNSEMSLSKQRKLARKKEIASMKRNAVLTKVILIVVCVLIVGLAAWLIIRNEIKKSKQVIADSNFSAQLENNGKIKNVTASDYITVADYKNISAAMADIEYSDEKVDEDIESVLEQNKYLYTSADRKAADGDKVNLDYKGTIDGVEFEGGSATAADHELGSGTFVDDFEEQIEGHSPGESFNVEVTFPDDYGTADLAGKDAVFAVTLNGIYVKPEFTDEFVAEKLSEHASTVSEYRQYLKDQHYRENLEDYTKKYVTENSTLKKTPSDYKKQLKANQKADENAYMQYINSMYSQYYGSTMYASFEDYLSKSYSMTEEQYDESLDEKVEDKLKYTLFCQAVADAEGITASVDEARERYVEEGGTEENFENQISTYGEGYVVQQLLCAKVLESVSDLVTVS